MERSTDVLLIGGGVASARCARTLRRNRFDGTVLLVGDEPMPPYNRPPLSKEFLRGEAPEELLAAEPPGWYERHAVTVRTDVRVTELDADAGRATLSSGERVSFERCLLATGAEPRPLVVPGGSGALLLRTLADARRLRAAASALERGAPVVVAGGGLIGVEVASALAVLGLRPTIVERSDSLWAGAMGGLLGGWAQRALEAAGVDVRLGSTVSAAGDGRVELDGGEIAAELVVAGIGVRARDELAAAAGIATASGVSVGPDQRTSHPAVWAAGDVARLNGTVTEHWHAAREAGERAALSMLGLPIPPVPPAWTFTEVAGTALDVIGHGEPGDDEAWIVEDRVAARSRGGRLVQLAIIASAVPADEARRLVERGSEIDRIREAIGV